MGSVATVDDSTLIELEALKTEREAWAGAHAYDPCQASHDKLMDIASRIRALAKTVEPTAAAAPAAEIPEELKALVRAAIGMHAHGKPPDPETFDHAEFTIITEFIRAVDALPAHLLRVCGIEER